MEGQHAHPGLADLGEGVRFGRLAEDIVTVGIQSNGVQRGHHSHLDPSHQRDGQISRDDHMGVHAAAFDVGVGDSGHVGVEVGVLGRRGGLGPPSLERHLALREMGGLLEVSGRLWTGEQVVVRECDHATGGWSQQRSGLAQD